MKQILITLFTFTTLFIYSQKQIIWFDCGLKVQGGSSGFYSKTIGDSKELNHELGYTSGYGYGAKLGVNWQYNGLSLEAFFNKSKQNIENISSASAEGWAYEWKAVDVYTLYRNAKNLGYFELGPKISFLNSYDLVTPAGIRDNRIDEMNKINYAGVLGFGANILGNDGRFSGILGLRFEYGFTDIINKDNNLLGPTFERTPTNPYFAGLVFEFNWGIGYFGRAQCGARSKFIMF